MKAPQLAALLRQEHLPAAIVDLDAFDRNAARMALQVQSSGKAIRVATKSLRVPELLRRALDRGAPYRGLMCYSAREAAYLHGEGFQDLLVAYPTLQSGELRLLKGVHLQDGKISLVVDGPENLRAVAEAMRGCEKPFPVIIEIDASLRLFGAHLGVRRSPIRTPADLERMIDAVLAYPSLAIGGVMSYEAQVAGLGDRNPFKPLLNPVASLVRKISVRSVSRRREEIRRVFERKKIPLPLFNGGGTGSLSYASHEPALTELAAGSGLFCPHLFDYYSNFDAEPAAFFALEVVRASDPGFVTCQGGGYIASGEPGWDRVPVPVEPTGLKLVPAEGCGEVQTPLRVPSNVSLRPGDAVVFRHAKAGELFERFTEVLLVSGGKITGRTRTYRGLGLSFF